MTEERINNYNDHATHMADIAFRILAGDEKILRVNGVKELIALFYEKILPKTAVKLSNDMSS